MFATLGSEFASAVGRSSGWDIHLGHSPVATNVWQQWEGELLSESPPHEGISGGGRGRCEEMTELGLPAPWGTTPPLSS